SSSIAAPCAKTGGAGSRESGVGERALAVTDAPDSSLPIPHSLNGIDVLKRDNFALLKDKRLGLITNHTGRDRDGNSAIDLLSKAPDVKLVALFSPQHALPPTLHHPNIPNSTHT